RVARVPPASASRWSPPTSVATSASSPARWAWLMNSAARRCARTSPGSVLRRGRDDHDRLVTNGQVAGLEARLLGTVHLVELPDEGIGRLEEPDLRGAVVHRHDPFGA